MRPLSSHFAHDALPTLDAFIKQTKKARVFRRAQAVRQVVAGQTVKAVSNTFEFTNSALRKWIKRFAQEGTDGLLDRPRSGRPLKMTSHRSKPSSTTSLIKTRSSTAPSMHSGAAVNLPPY